MESVRRKLAATDDGARQMVEAACAEALGRNVHSADVILNILARYSKQQHPRRQLTYSAGANSAARPPAADRNTKIAKASMSAKMTREPTIATGSADV